MRHTTINDLTKLLNLSPSTVSRALRDHQDISKGTKEKVLEMAAHTNYQPNSIAQSLQNRRSDTNTTAARLLLKSFYLLKTELIVRESS
jgi:DNA-binding LacI/PurR family transcriptional regulator